MKTINRSLFYVLIALTLVSSNAIAGDFDWIGDFNIRAEADPSGIRASLGTRFKIGPAEIEAVLGDVTKPSDAYMVFRLGEMCGKPASYVMEQYKAGKGQGWGVLAKNLGIKPGSREFKTLKQGHDLDFAGSEGKGNGKKSKKDKKKGKSKNKGKGKK